MSVAFSVQVTADGEVVLEPAVTAAKPKSRGRQEKIARGQIAFVAFALILMIVATVVLACRFKDEMQEDIGAMTQAGQRSSRELRALREEMEQTQAMEERNANELAAQIASLDQALQRTMKVEQKLFEFDNDLGEIRYGQSGKASSVLTLQQSVDNAKFQLAAQQAAIQRAADDLVRYRESGLHYRVGHVVELGGSRPLWSDEL
mmetsp:Transcript_46137/g.121894  ORF Transcript_46137/g.121894 Transcript_46137/m.121894 type:complete len:204 (-) Transcript_46137:92-703(-)